MPNRRRAIQRRGRALKTDGNSSIIDENVVSTIENCAIKRKNSIKYLQLDVSLRRNGNYSHLAHVQDPVFRVNVKRIENAIISLKCRVRIQLGNFSLRPVTLKIVI